MHAKVPIKTCILRQTRGYQDYNCGSCFYVPPECINCDTGKHILESHGLLPRKRTSIKYREYIECHNCGRQEPHYKHHMCISCGRVWKKYHYDEERLQWEFARMRVIIKKYGSNRKRLKSVSQEEIKKELEERGYIKVKKHKDGRQIRREINQEIRRTIYSDHPPWDSPNKEKLQDSCADTSYR